MPPRRRSLALGLACAAPSIIVACSLAPLSSSGAGSTSSSTSTASGTGGATTSSSATGGVAASSSSSGSSSSSSSSGTGGSGGGPVDAGDAGDSGEADGPLECNTMITEYPLVAGLHVPVCSPIAYTSNPPTSGPHYPIWAAFRSYATPVPRGFYVHDLEHGAIVITYNCPAGCDAELGQLAAFLDARPTDPLCLAPVKARVVVTPDPLIPTRFAASSWGWALTSNCLDLATLGPFMDAHYGMGTEDFCNDGVDVTAPDAGLPVGCSSDPVDAG